MSQNKSRKTVLRPPRLSLTVLAFRQDIWRRNIHNFLQNKRERLLRSRWRDGTSGLERQCHRGFAWHCSLLGSEDDGAKLATEAGDKTILSNIICY